MDPFVHYYRCLVMAKISFQFHATPEELLQFAHQVMLDPKVHVSAVIQKKPFEVMEMSSNQLDDYFAAVFQPKRLFFTLNSPVLSTTGTLDFAEKNPDFLHLSVGVLRHEGLEESWLAAKTENLVAIRK